MNPPQIRMHLPAHRRRSLSLQTERLAAERAYDTHIAAYVRYLREEANAAGYTLETDQQDGEDSFSYADVEAGGRAAHAWLHRLPDLWNWIP